MAFSAYEGTEPYIFISYAHKDSATVLPIIEALSKRGFRIWYDAGIEAGTEWPEYIAEHLAGCSAFLAFISTAAVASKNCRQEINFAIDLDKEPLAVHLEDVSLTLGMKMRLNTFQAMFYNRHPDLTSFVDALSKSQILANCRNKERSDAPAPVSKAAPHSTTEPQSKPTPIPTPVTPASIIPEKPVPTKAEPTTPPPAPKPQIIHYALNKDGESYHLKVIENAKDSHITIPAVYNGKPVSAIGDHAFTACSTLTHITLPNSVISIGKSAFSNCRNLTEITFGKGVTSINDEAFLNCEKLKTVVLPDRATLPSLHPQNNYCTL